MLSITRRVARHAHTPPSIAIAATPYEGAVRVGLRLRTPQTRAMTANTWVPNRYPPARRSDHIDVYKSAKDGEVRVADPYAWLEKDTPETDEWVSAQERFARDHLDQIPDRQRLEDGIRANMDYARFSPPSLKGDRWYWYHNSGLQPQYIMYRSADSSLPDLSGKDDSPGGEVFFDMNLLSDDGTVALSTSAFSKCGQYFAYGVSVSGSDVCNIYVRKTDAPLVQKGDKRPSHHDERLSDDLGFVKFSSITWTHDSKGFFYQRYPVRDAHGIPSGEDVGIATASDENAVLYYHRIGTPQSEDVIVMKDDNQPKYMWSVSIDEHEGRWIKLYISRDTSSKNLLWVADLQANEIGPNMKWTKIVDEFEASYSCRGHIGSKMVLLTNKDAPRYKVVTVDLADEKKTLHDLVSEDEEALLGDVTAVHDDKLLLVYTRNVQDELYVYSNTGKRLQRLAQDFVGSLNVTGRATKQPEAFVTMSGFTTPGTIVKYDLALPEKERKLETWRTTVLKGLNPSEFSAEQVWFESKDGTKVPMFIVKHSSTKLDGTAPAIQYAYGGFNISVLPAFKPSVLTFLKAYGGVYAQVNIRGGGEFGKEWHLAGTRERKTNCFDDFIAAAQHLVEKKYAGPGKVAIHGGSNGGLLVAATVQRAPEGTIGAGLAQVGVHDYLKFHKFTIGHAWTSDFGDPDEPADFDFMHPISPVHNVSSEKPLPSLLLTTADHDDRVVPMHSFKLAAAIQHARPHNAHPLLLRVQKKAGHGAGKSTEQQVKEAADMYAFVANAFGLHWLDK